MVVNGKAPRFNGPELLVIVTLISVLAAIVYIVCRAFGIVGE